MANVISLFLLSAVKSLDIDPFGSRLPSNLRNTIDYEYVTALKVLLGRLYDPFSTYRHSRSCQSIGAPYIDRLEIIHIALQISVPMNIQWITRECSDTSFFDRDLFEYISALDDTYSYYPHIGTEWKTAYMAVEVAKYSKYSRTPALDVFTATPKNLISKEFIVALLVNNDLINTESLWAMWLVLPERLLGDIDMYTKIIASWNSEPDQRWKVTLLEFDLISAAVSCYSAICANWSSDIVDTWWRSFSYEYMETLRTVFRGLPYRIEPQRRFVRTDLAPTEHRDDISDMMSEMYRVD